MCDLSIHFVIKHIVNVVVEGLACNVSVSFLSRLGSWAAFEVVFNRSIALFSV